MSEEHRKRVVDKCHEYNEIGPLDDGFQCFWIKDRGAASAFDLRCIADELDRLNAPLKAELDEHHKNQLIADIIETTKNPITVANYKMYLPLRTISELEAVLACIRQAAVITPGKS